jgi:signal transduction histidine kinase/DNA-binding NarL/FixJ family response regulator
VKDLRVLVCAPVGRDRALTVELLKRAAIPCHVCGTLREVCDGMAEGAGVVLLTEEVLNDPALDVFVATLNDQPAWSDISILLFAGGDRHEIPLRQLDTLGNVTVLDRPVRMSAVLSTVHAALRGRQRQYEMRDVLLALHKARTDAEEANRLKDEFLATVSHELRTPLNAIMGWVSLLRQARFDPQRVASVLEIVSRNAKAQAQIIADILDISRMITGRMKLNLAAVSLAGVILDAVDTVRPTAAAKGLEIHTDIDEGAVVNGDGERLQQVFWNILSNATKFTPAGGRIDVTLREDGDRALLRVTDTGSGIAPEFLPYVFDRFRQADQTFTRAHGGLGLGLAIVKHIVERHGGEVVAQSEGLGKGAAFEVRIPITETVSVRIERRDQSQDTNDAAIPDVDLSARTVLIVDDDEATRELMTAMLGQCGARVTAVDGAQRALAELDFEVPSLIVADLGMPHEDGLSMMRRIRQRSPERGGQVTAIALSAYVREDDKRAAFDAGFDYFVTKPATPADVIRAVDRALTAPGRRSAPAEPLTRPITKSRKRARPSKRAKGAKLTKAAK